MFNNQYGQGNQPPGPPQGTNQPPMANTQQQQQPVNPQQQQVMQQQQAMQQQQQHMQQQQQQQMPQQPQQQANNMHDIDDPVIQIKKMVPRLKESLNSVMTMSSKVLEFNCRVDYTGTDRTAPPSVEQNKQTRNELQNSFEEFYHTADLLEAQIKLAQQQCMNTLQAVSTVSPQYVHFNRGMQGPAGMNNFELGRYNEYIEIVKDQISCATEASEILSKSYRDLKKIDVPGAGQRRNPNTNNANNRVQQPPSSPAVSQQVPQSPGMAGGGGGGPTTPGAVISAPS